MTDNNIIDAATIAKEWNEIGFVNDEQYAVFLQTGEFPPLKVVDNIGLIKERAPHLIK